MVRIRLSASCRRSVPLVASLPTFNKPTLGRAPARKRLQLQPNAANYFNCSTDTFKLAPKSNINNGLLTVGNKVANAGLSIPSKVLSKCLDKIINAPVLPGDKTA